MKKPICSFISISAACFMTGLVMATDTYTYENDGKTLVATVSGGDVQLTTSAADQAWFTDSITNFVKRGDKSLNVWANAVASYTGDIRLEQGTLNIWGSNALGINMPHGVIQLQQGKLVQGSNSQSITIAKEIAFGIGGEWTGRSLEVWEGRTATVTGKITTGNRNAYLYVYRNAVLNVAGGIEDPASGGAGYLCVGAYNGATLTFTEKPVVMSNPIYFTLDSSYNPDSLRDESGYFSHITFAVPSNSMMSVGYHNDSGNSRLRYQDLRTTVDWAFDKSGMKVYFGNDARWDLCGTEQRVGQFDVKVTSGNASVVTNSLAAPATLHMGMIYEPSASTPNIRFGGNLSVVFEGDIGNTKINHEMTAKGCLTVNQTGTLNFLENGSWANATNVTVKGSGKITIANPNALGWKANVNLASNSSLEIASGVTVTVRTLKVGGVEKLPGDYTFGSGTLHVSPSGFQLRVR